MAVFKQICNVKVNDKILENQKLHRGKERRKNDCKKIENKSCIITKNGL